MGEGIAKDSLRSALPSSHDEREEELLREVRQGEGCGRTKRTHTETEGTQRGFQEATGRSHWKCTVSVTVYKDW